MTTYSAEKFPDGSVVIFLHCRYGVVPYVWIRNQVELEKVVIMLQECQTKVPDVFREAMDGNCNEQG